MTIISMHLRWDGLTAEQQSAARDVLDDLHQHGPSGCHSSSSRSAGAALLATLVWQDEESAARFTGGRLADLVTTERMPAPQTACFAVSEIFAAGYRRSSGVPVPAPRRPQEAAQPRQRVLR